MWTGQGQDASPTGLLRADREGGAEDPAGIRATKSCDFDLIEGLVRSGGKEAQFPLRRGSPETSQDQGRGGLEEDPSSTRCGDFGVSIAETRECLPLQGFSGETARVQEGRDQFLLGRNRLERASEQEEAEHHGHRF